MQYWFPVRFCLAHFGFHETERGHVAARGDSDPQLVLNAGSLLAPKPSIWPHNHISSEVKSSQNRSTLLFFSACMGQGCMSFMLCYISAHHLCVPCLLPLSFFFLSKTCPSLNLTESFSLCKKHQNLAQCILILYLATKVPRIILFIFISLIHPFPTSCMI